MGEAWLAHDKDLDADVVVKLLPDAATREQVALLRQECRIARRLSHPGIVKVFDFHQSDGRSFITMEYVQGGDLGQLGAASTATLLRRLLTVIEALEYAHREGVVHRDLKSSNLLMDQTGRLRLTDFGISGLLEPGDGDLTLSRGGSRASMSPQQLDGEPPSPADDLYGLGCLLYELVVGRAPLGPNPSDEEIRLAPPAPVSAQRSLPAGLPTLITRLMAKSTARRPSDMTEVRQAVEGMLDSWPPDMTRPPRLEERTVVLTPPPRVRASDPGGRTANAAHTRSRGGDPRHWRRMWLTAAVFVLLAAAVMAVFVVLPRWVQQRRSGRIADGLAAGSRPVASAATQDHDAAADDADAQSLAGAADRPAQPESRSSEGSSQESRPRRDRPAAARTTPPPLPPAPARSGGPESEAFSQAMSAGLAALEEGELGEARQAFERALAVAPASGEAAEGLARTEQAVRLAAIADHRERARALEEEERWREAVREYDAVLAIDEAVRFAAEGRQRALERAALGERLEFHLAHSDRLASTEVLEEVRRLLEQARALAPQGVQLRGQLERLNREVERAATPVKVVLVSDNLTRVWVYRVGNLGSFERKTVELRPGTYTVVGVRDGFRDVRKQIRVVPGVQPEELVVRCEEGI